MFPAPALFLLAGLGDKGREAYHIKISLGGA
nr:MAG TPA_asm: hypothetical protein [Caudoviricetes sp.]